MSRTFFVRVNMDDMCAELDTLRPDQHAEWLAGFRSGCRGKIPPGWDGPRLMGAEFGLSCWEEAEGYRAKQSDKGKRSAQVRAAKSGTADPRANREPNVNHGSTTVRTACEPNVNPSNIQHPTSNSEQPATLPAPSHCDIFDPPTASGPIQASPANINACDAKYAHGDTLAKVRSIMGKLNKANANLPQWQDIIDEYGWEAVRDAAKGVGPAERWPDRVAQVIFDKDKCPYPEGTDKAVNWYVLNGKYTC